MRIFHVCFLLSEDTGSMWWHRFVWWMPRLGRLWVPYIIIEPQWEREWLTEIEQTRKRWHIITHHHNWAGIDVLICTELCNATLHTTKVNGPNCDTPSQCDFPWALTVFDLKKKKKSLSYIFLEESRQRYKAAGLALYILSIDIQLWSDFYQLLWTLRVYSPYKLNINTHSTHFKRLRLHLSFSWWFIPEVIHSEHVYHDCAFGFAA